MNVDAAIARMTARMPAGALGYVGPCDGPDDAIQQLKAGRPSAFVMFTGLGGGDAQGGSGVTRQKMTYRWMVLIGAMGAGFKALSKTNALEAMRDQVLDANMGWVPPGCASPTVLVSARTMLRDEDRALLFFSIEFQTTLYITKQESQ